MGVLLTSYKHRLNTFLFLGIFLAIPFGYLVPESTIVAGFVGEIFLRLLYLLIVPIIVVSMLNGILQFEDSSQLGKIGLRAILYYALTTAIAVATGLMLVNLINPGASTSPDATPQVLEAVDAGDEQDSAAKRGGLENVARKIIPKNVVGAASEGNVLGLIFFTTLLAVALLMQGERCTQHVKPVVHVLFDALIWLVDVIMLTAPIGIFALVSSTVSDAVINQTLTSMGVEIGWYFLTVLAGLLTHGLISLPLLLYFFGTSPLQFAKAMLPALTTAFSTASSSATLPLTIDCLKERASVSERVANFVAPLGATVNMDGTAIYEAVAAIFIANMYGVDLTFAEQFVIFLTATFSAVGAAGIPGAGLIMMTLVLDSVGLPAEGIALIVGVDRILDMFRTSINVWGDSIGAAIIAKGTHESVEVAN